MHEITTNIANLPDENLVEVEVEHEVEEVDLTILSQNAFEFDESLRLPKGTVRETFEELWICKLIRCCYEIQGYEKAEALAKFHFNVLISNVRQSWLVDPDNVIKISMDRNYYTNSEILTYAYMVKAIRASIAEGLIEIRRGERRQGNTCIWPTKKLIETFESLEDS